MSSTTWMDYVNELVNGIECIKRAAIIGYPDASVWACSEDFKPIGDEVQQLVHMFSNNVVPRIAHLEGVPFLVPHAEPTYIVGFKSHTTLRAFKKNKVVVVVVTEDEGDQRTTWICRGTERCRLLREAGFLI